MSSRFYEGGKSVLSFRGKFYTGTVFPWGKDGPGMIFPGGQFCTRPIFQGGKSNQGPFFRGGGGVGVGGVYAGGKSMLQHR
jgi:hypothetical protein